MPRLFIHVCNSEFRSRDEGGDYELPAAALRLGVQSAMGIASDEVGRGERSAAVEVSVEQEDGAQVLRSVVSVSVSPLILIGRPADLDA